MWTQSVHPTGSVQWECSKWTQRHSYWRVGGAESQGRTPRNIHQRGTGGSFVSHKMTAGIILCIIFLGLSLLAGAGIGRGWIRRLPSAMMCRQHRRKCHVDRKCLNESAGDQQRWDEKEDEKKGERRFYETTHNARSGINVIQLGFTSVITFITFHPSARFSAARSSDIILQTFTADGKWRKIQQ